MKQQANNKTYEILNSIEGIKKIKAPDFFYTRLRAKMETSPLIPKSRRFLRPAYAVAFFALLIIFNIISLLNPNYSSEENTANSEVETTQTIASAYNFDDGFSYELNQ